MPRSRTRTTSAHRMGVLMAGTASLLGTAVAPAAAAPPDDVIVLPEATSAEGIAQGDGGTFYAGDLFRGDVFRGDLEAGTAELFIDAPDGRMAVGMSADRRHDLLFVAGGFSGQGFVYDTDTGETVAEYTFASPSAPDAAPATMVNDVAVTRGGAWFTDSRRAALYFVPVSRDGEPGDPRTLELHGPAADTGGAFNLNGIAADCSGDALVVGHSARGAMYTVDPGTGDSAEIAGVDVPGVDGIVLEGRDLWAVQGGNNRVTQFRLSGDLSSGELVEVIEDEDFQTPSTAIRYDDHLAVVNAKFDTGVPPTADTYEVVLVDD